MKVRSIDDGSLRMVDQEGKGTDFSHKERKRHKKRFYVIYAFFAVGPSYQSTLTVLITTAWTGTSWCMPRLPVLTFSIVCTTSIPSTTWPKTAYP
jgi:hypothetical protein